MATSHETGVEPTAAETAQLRSAIQELLTRISALESRAMELEQELRKAREETEQAKAQVAEIERRALERFTATPAPPAETAAPRADEPATVESAATSTERPPEPVAPPAPAEPIPALPPPPDPGQIVEAALDPRKLFGPAGNDGQPCHVLLDLLSRDALGAVYRACERATSRFFAVRFMAGQAGEEQTAAIEREVEKLIALPHPNILHVQGSGRRQNRLYIAMDLVEAQPLGRVKVPEIRRIAAIFRDAADAVHYAHEEGILHGDLSPENVLVAREDGREHGLVKDFGLGFLMENVLPTSGRQAGLLIRSPSYLPPEQMKEIQGSLSVAADVYGLGATLYATLTGRPPFEGKDVRQVRSRVLFEEPLPLERARADCPEALAAIVRRSMAKEISLRYPSAKEMSESLTKFLEGRVSTIRRQAPVEGR